ncbi:glycoside hydrolase family 99-like domain-containing protein, partial [Acinetobacter baumannii]
YGFDAALEFPPHKLARDMPAINDSLQIVNPDYAGMVLDYRQLVERAVNWPLPDYALFRGLSPGWDNEARKPGRGYTFAHATPSHY